MRDGCLGLNELSFIDPFVRLVPNIERSGFAKIQVRCVHLFGGLLTLRQQRFVRRPHTISPLRRANGARCLPATRFRASRRNIAQCAWEIAAQIHTVVWRRVCKNSARIVPHPRAVALCRAIKLPSAPVETYRFALVARGCAARVHNLRWWVLASVHSGAAGIRTHACNRCDVGRASSEHNNA
jgi:hypothetical protein